MNGTGKNLIKVTKDAIIPTRHFLSDILNVIRPFPEGGAVILGIATDGLPVAWDVKDRHEQNIVVWDKHTRQSLYILKVASEYMFSHQKDMEIEFVVLTTHPKDYGKLNEYGMGTNSKTPCIGIIPFFSKLTDVVMQGLCRWIHESHTSAKRPVVILIDGLENVDKSSEAFQESFRQILDIGRSKHVHVLATSSKSKFHEVYKWLDGFQCEMYGMDIPDEFEYVEGADTVIFYTPRTELL